MANLEVSGVAVEVAYSFTTAAEVSGLATETSYTFAGQGLEVAGLSVEYSTIIPIGELAVSGLSVEVSYYVPPVEEEIVPVEFITETVELPALVLVNSIEQSTLTGIYASAQLNIAVPETGWLWDRRRIENLDYYYSQYVSTLGGHVVGLLDGTNISYWQSGVVTGIDYVSTEYVYLDNYAAWVPTYSVGTYSTYYQRKTLYSDNVYTSLINGDSTYQGLLSKKLRDDAKLDTLTVAIYSRDGIYNIYKHREYVYVDTFTGVIDGGQRVAVETNGVIDSALAESRKYEYCLRDNAVVLNQNTLIDKTFVTGGGFDKPPANTNTGDLVEALGQADPERYYLTKFFPLVASSVKLWVSDGVELNAVELVDSLAYLDSATQGFELDADLGIIKVSGFTAPDLVLKVLLGMYDSFIYVYEESAMLAQWPDKGVISINGESISYTEKTTLGFGNLVRGYNNTEISIHDKGSTLAHAGTGKLISGEMYLEYKACPRIDYEITTGSTRTANKSPVLDVNPIKNVETSNVVQIYPGDIVLDSITLSTTSPYIASNLYGPVFYGTDISELTATAYDPNGNPIHDIAITTFIVEGTGFLNGNVKETLDLTNTSGETYSFYNHPVTQDELEKEVLTVSYSAGDTVMHVPGMTGKEMLDDIWIFQTLKHDQAIGTIGLPLLINAEGLADLPYGLWYLDLNGLLDEDYKHGVINIIIAGIKYVREITWLEDRVSGGANFTRAYIDVAIPTAVGSRAYCLPREAIEWDPVVQNGSKYILYQYTEESQHPKTRLPGAWAPIHPTAINGEYLTFQDLLLPIPNAFSNSTNLGGYVVLSDGEVTIQARGKDPLTGRIVESNKIRLLLTLPSLFIGVDKTGVLPIPYGWTFPTEEFNVGSALGGANFIDINPKAISQLVLKVNFGV